MSYSREVDGLRALAIASVIAAHAGLQVARGGFIGVDVFFVISGYLITKSIRADIAAGHFSLAHFLEKRTRRILPALLVVMLVTSPFAGLWMLPEYLKSFGQSVVATIFFSNNVLLAKTSGYWDLESSFKPLLHTWSLGVEEQFYLAFPVLILALRKQKKETLSFVLAGLSAISIVAAQISSVHWPAINFYLPFGRAWELFAGALCALTRLDARPAAGAALSATGLALILASVLFLSEETPSPSIFLLPAVLGSALVIQFANASNFTGATLGSAPLVGVGLVSYSAYLWHQPMFALARVYGAEPPDQARMALLILALAPISYLSYRFIEQPFRRRSSVSTRTFVQAGGIASAALIVGGLYLHVRRGMPERLQSGGDDLAVSIDYNERIRGFSIAHFPENGRPNVLIVGNSLARDIANVLLEAQFLDGKNMLYQPDRPKDCRRPSDGYAGSFGTQFGKADLIVLAGIAPVCTALLVEASRATGKMALAVGPKDFGYNLNPFMRIPIADRLASRTTPRPEAVRENEAYRALVPADNYLDLMLALGGDGKTLPVFDAEGHILSQDRMHFTQAGARFAAPTLLNAVLRLQALKGTGGS